MTFIISQNDEAGLSLKPDQTLDLNESESLLEVSNGVVYIKDLDKSCIRRFLIDDHRIQMLESRAKMQQAIKGSEVREALSESDILEM